MSDFASNLKKLRIKNKLTQEGLAKKLGVGKSTISMYESGAREPNLEMLEVIADFFNVNLDKLVTGYDYRSKVLEKDTNLYGNHEKNIEAFKHDPELLEFYMEMHESDNLRLLFDTARELTPKELEKVLRYMKLVIEEEL